MEEEKYLTDWFHPFYTFLVPQEYAHVHGEELSTESNRTHVGFKTYSHQKAKIREISVDLFHTHFQDCLSPDEQWCCLLCYVVVFPGDAFALHSASTYG